jgi:copper chaperone CopZ
MAYTFNVKDMTCGGCAASIRNAVTQVPGVQGIEIDVPSRQVVVDAPANVPAETIVAAMSAAGYTAMSQPEAAAPDVAAGTSSGHCHTT